MQDRSPSKPPSPATSLASSLEELVELDADALDRVMRGGHAIDEDAIANRRYDGVSLNLPGVIERLTWTKFAKVFHRDDDGSLRGWNCKVRQTPLDEPWELVRARGRPVTYGHYRVRPAGAYPDMPRPYGAALMLDYGLGGNARLDPTGRVRDPIVAVHEGSSDLLLGWTYLDLGWIRAGTPSFFALRRGEPLEHVADPPRRR